MSKIWPLGQICPTSCFCYIKFCWNIVVGFFFKVRAVDLVEIFSVKHCFSNEVGVISINHTENVFKPQI